MVMVKLGGVKDRDLAARLRYLDHKSPFDTCAIVGRQPQKMSAQNSKGIQTLLDAEREAQRIVQKAREYRSKRVKDARTEAQKEIEEYRKQKDDEFKEFEKKHTSGNKKAEEDASKDAEEQLKHIKEAGNKTGDKVVELLLSAVTDVKPEIPDRVAAPPEA